MSQQATYLYRAIFAHNIINITFFQNAKSCRKIKKTFIFWNEMNWNTLIKENIFMRYICFPMENNYMLKSYICKKNFLLGCSVRILRTQIFRDFIPFPICTHDIRTSLDPPPVCHMPQNGRLFHRMLEDLRYISGRLAAEDNFLSWILENVRTPNRRTQFYDPPNPCTHAVRKKSDTPPPELRR